MIALWEKAPEVALAHGVGYGVTAVLLLLQVLAWIAAGIAIALMCRSAKRGALPTVLCGTAAFSASVLSLFCWEYMNIGGTEGWMTSMHPGMATLLVMPGLLGLIVGYLGFRRRKPGHFG
jgi:ABC-type anion transport system duplicated permease subunit